MSQNGFANNIHFEISGESLYSDSRLLIDSSVKAVERAKALESECDEVMRIGVSPTTPADVLTDLYPVIYRQWPELKFQVIPFENTPQNASEILENLGENIDIVAGVFDEGLLRYRSESLNKVLVTNEVWHRAHPLLHTISVKWEFDMSYGLLYSTKPSPKVKHFLQIIQDSILK